MELKQFGYAFELRHPRTVAQDFRCAAFHRLPLNFRTPFLFDQIAKCDKNQRCSGGGVRGAVSPCSAHHAPYLTALPPVDRAAVGVILTTHRS